MTASAFAKMPSRSIDAPARDRAWRGCDRSQGRAAVSIYAETPQLVIEVKAL